MYKWVGLVLPVISWIFSAEALAQYPQVPGVVTTSTYGRVIPPPGPGSWYYWHDIEVRPTVLLGRTRGGSFVNVRGYEYVDYGRTRKDYKNYLAAESERQYWSQRPPARNGRRHGKYFRYHKGNSSHTLR